MKNILFSSILLLGILVLSSFQRLEIAQFDQHEYAALTERRIEAALSEGGTEADLLLAEGSLTALGWFVLFSNNDKSFELAKKYDKKTFDKYNGTDMIFIRQKNQCFSEMLNLGRFEKKFPKTVSTEYAEIVSNRVQAAFADEAAYPEFKLAEGSLCALGWMTLFGNGAESMAHAENLMNLAYKTFPNSDGYYMMQSSEAYGEIINLGRFEMDGIEDNTENEVFENRFLDQGNGTVLDNNTGLIWLQNPIKIEAKNWAVAMNFAANFAANSNTLSISDNSQAGDWRLPTNEEWEAMANWEQATGSGVFKVKNEGNYWSSTTPVNEYGAYHLNIFGSGKADFDNRNRALNIWLVRN